MDTLNALCKALRCQAGDLIEYVPDRKKEIDQGGGGILLWRPGAACLKDRYFILVKGEFGNGFALFSIDATKFEAESAVSIFKSVGGFGAVHILSRP